MYLLRLPLFPHHRLKKSRQGKDDGKVVWSNREKASAFLDMRLLLKAAVMNANEWKQSKNLLQDFYVEYYVTCKSNERQIELDKDASNLINNVAVDEAADTSSIENEEEQQEKVCIDSDSDGDDVLISNNTIATEQQLKTADEDAGRLEFKTVSKKWCAYSNSFSDEKWRLLYPELQKEIKLDMVEDLMPLSLKAVMDDINKFHNLNEKCFGYLPVMVGCSKCQLGALTAQSFAERINSAAKEINTKDRLKMDPVLIDKLVTIRMNKCFMEFVRENVYKGDILLIPGFDDKIDEVNNLWS